MYKYSSSTPPKRKRGQATLLFIIVIGVALAATVIFLINRDSEPIANPNEQTPTSTINLEPPTEEEKQAGNEQKEKITEQQEQQEEQSSQQLADSVSVVIVDAAQYGEEIEVRAFASNIIADGTCIVTFTRDSESFTREVDAFADASTTPCINVFVPRGEFSTEGEWTVTVEYRNETMTGTAQSTILIE